MAKKKESPERNKWKLGGVIAALLAAFAIFAVMLQMEKNLLAEYEKGTVYVAIAQIPKGQLITEENMALYLEERELDKSCIADSALSEPGQLQGLIAAFTIEPGVLLAEGMFRQQSRLLEDMEEPVIAGMKGDDLFQVVGGVLRAGDCIHIYAVDEENETHLLWENIYVQGVFDQSGIAIANKDAETSAQRVNVYMDKRDVEEFYSGLANGTLRVVKAYDGEVSK